MDYAGAWTGAKGRCHRLGYTSDDDDRPAFARDGGSHGTRQHREFGATPDEGGPCRQATTAGFGDGSWPRSHEVTPAWRVRAGGHGYVLARPPFEELLGCCTRGRTHKRCARLGR